MTDIKCLEYDDEAAIIFIQKKLPKELNISDDEIQYVLDVIYDFYESKGWMVGKNRMKDWKAAVRTWESSERSASPRPQAISQAVNPFTELKRKEGLI